MAKLQNLLISILLVGLVSLGFIGFLSYGAEKYSIDGYDNSTLQTFYNETENIESITLDTRDNLYNASTESGNLDIFGGFLVKSWRALKSTWKAMDTFSNLSDEAVGSINFINGAFSDALSTAITGIIIIIFVIGIFAHFIAKSDRL